MCLTTLSLWGLEIRAVKAPLILYDGLGNPVGGFWDTITLGCKGLGGAQPLLQQSQESDRLAAAAAPLK